MPAAILSLKVPRDASAVLWSADGTEWTPLPNPRVRDLIAVTRLDSGGYVVAAARDDARPRWRRVATRRTCRPSSRYRQDPVGFVANADRRAR